MNPEQLATVVKSVMQAVLSLAIVAAYLYLTITSSQQAANLNAPVVAVFAFWFGQSVMSYLQARTPTK